MKYCIVCPFCGYALKKIKHDEITETQCQNCKKKYIIEIRGNFIGTQRITRKSRKEE